jgi:hypothetical protein
MQLGPLPVGLVSAVWPDLLPVEPIYVRFDPPGFKRKLLKLEQRSDGIDRIVEMEDYADDLVACVEDPQSACRYKDRINLFRAVVPPPYENGRATFMLVGLQPPEPGGSCAQHATAFLISKQKHDRFLKKWPSTSNLQFGGQHRRRRTR